MNYRTQDVIAWDHLPHPDPRSRRQAGRFSVTPAFWTRLGKHVRAETAAGAWAAWLTPAGVQALSGQTLRPERLTLVAGRLYDGLVRSLGRPLVLKFESGATSMSRPSFFALLMPNGATMTLRGNAAELEIEDCFFGRAAMEAGGHGEAEHHDHADGLSEPFASGRAAQQAAIQEYIRRYAIADPARGFVLPGEPGSESEQGGTSTAGGYRVTFIEPMRWGFAGEEPGAEWIGAIETEPEMTADDRRVTANPRLNPKQLNMPAHLNGSRPKKPQAASLTASSAASAASARRSDPFRCLDRIQRLMHPAADRDTGSGLHATYEAAVAIGECRLFSVDAELTDASFLTPADAIRVADELTGKLSGWTRQAERLRDRLPSVGGLAAENLRLGLVESRMEAWAAYLAIDAAFNRATDTADLNADRLSASLDAVLTEIESFDAALESAESCLGLGEQTRLITNWRTMLTGTFADLLPWWLQPAEVAVGV